MPGNAEWFRSGVVLEGGNVYRITWLRGKWRNGNDPECGPAGEALPWIRRQYPNLPRILMPRCPIYTHDQAKRTEKTQKEPVPRMTLIATHAHPQAWPPREEKLRALFQYVVRKDPDELVGQLAPIGKDLNNEGSSVCLQIGSDIPAGMLWLFANDIWVAACDNSGAVRLRIERIDTRDPGQPLWTLAKDKPTARWRRDLAEAAQ